MGNRTLLTAGALAVLGMCSASGQLAITEINSSAATNLGPTVVSQDSDWWELTNFGTNTVDLTGYKWNDNQGGLITADPAPFNGLTIGPGESIIFFQTNVPSSTNAEQFRRWWGLNPSVQAVVFFANGLGSTGDGIRLWGPSAVDDADVVDSVDFGVALRGSTFVYNRSTGLFDTYSTNGTDGAFKAQTTDDVGSPGTTAGPVPLAITGQPTNTSVNPGDTAVFTVVASGLPRPAYQWFFSGAPIAGARFASLFVTNAQSDNLGAYSVALDNGVTALTSSEATLGLNAQPEPPQFVISPRDKNVFVGQSVTLAALASGVPQPTYQWRFNGADLAGATDVTYTIPSVALADAGSYSVVARNSLGAATNQATLVVTPRPRLVITEIMAAESTNGGFGGHNDWWEVSNLDDFPVVLDGYRFDDSSATMAAAVTFTNHFTIAPGESVVFVESMTPDEFRRWWGPANLPPDLQIIPYAGAALSLSSLGDAINLWNSDATEDFDTISSEVFSTATAGVSFGYDADTQTFGELSEEGLRGAWRAPENGDIGSPGYLRNPLEPRIIRFTKEGSICRLRWSAEPNTNYTLEFRSGLGSADWTPLSTTLADGPFVTVEVPNPAGQGFFRVRRGP